MKIYRTYNKVARYFEKPRIKWFGGLYLNDPSVIAHRKSRVKLFGKWIELPWWLKFEFRTCDVVYKHKWDSVRYEHPPRWSLVLFGISLSFWLVPPTHNQEYLDCNYWESMIEWSEKENRSPYLFKEHLIDESYWFEMTGNERIGIMSTRKEWVKPEFHTSWEIAKSVLTKQAKEKGVMLL